jgi:hypothetical protein
MAVGPHLLQLRYEPLEIRQAHPFDSGSSLEKAGGVIRFSLRNNFLLCSVSDLPSTAQVYFSFYSEH